MAIFEININEKISNATIGEDVNRGDLLYLHNDSKWYKTSAGTKTRSTTELMLALEGGQADSQIDLLNYGYFDFEDSILDPKRKYYVSVNDGKIIDNVYEDEGYVIRYVGTAFTNSVLLFNPDQTYISDGNTKINEVTIAGSGGISYFENDIVVALSDNKTVGKYKNGDIIPSAGMTFEEFAKDIAAEIISPTYDNPKISSITDDISREARTSSSPNSQKSYIEVGTTVNLKLTINADRGLIKGDLDGDGVWKTNLNQGPYAGLPTDYEFKKGSDSFIATVPQGIPNIIYSNYIVSSGVNPFEGKVTFDTGDDYRDSAENIISGLPINSKTLTYNSIVGSYKIFHGPNYGSQLARNLPYTFFTSNSQEIYTLTGTTHNVFDLYIPYNKKINTAVSENTFENLISKYIETSGIVSVPDASNANVNYRHYRLTNDTPYTTEDRHIITIKNA